MKTTENISNEIRQFIVGNFLFGDGDHLEDHTSFMENGIIDSTGILELVSYLEENYLIKIQDEELLPENLDSLNNVTSFLGRKLSCVE